MTQMWEDAATTYFLGVRVYAFGLYAAMGCALGLIALALILDELRREGRYDHVEVCVKKADKAAIRLYERHGFTDSGYVDEDVPDALNMICRLTGRPV